MFNRGLIFAMLSAFMFSIMNVMVKEISQTMATGEIVFVRSIIGVIIILIIMKSCHIKFSHKDIPTLFFRGIVGGISMFLLFIAVSGMPLGDVSILQQLSAFFVLLISVFYLKEKLPLKAIAPLIIIVLGTCLILRPWEYNSFSIYALLAIASAFLGAVAYTTIHKLFASGGHNSWEIVFYFLFCSTIVGFISMYNNYRFPTNYEAILLLGIGITSLLAQAFMTQAYRLANQILVSFIMYLGVFLNAIWGYVFFNEIMNILSIIGGIFIIGSSLYLTTTKNKITR